MSNQPAILAPIGRLDSNNSAAFEEEAMKHLRTTTSGIIFDFTELTYVSSAGLRVVLLAAKRVKQAGGQFVLCGLSEPIREVFKVSGFLTILTVVPDRAAALSHFS
jgi:stage II sporulation protein AA (anti-sigma F factor antagonist)